MKRFLKRVAYIVGAFLVLLLFIWIGFMGYSNNRLHQTMKLAGVASPRLKHQGFVFRDLNKNGRLDAYEDARVPLAARVENLLQQMTLEEKAGTLFISMAGMGREGKLQEMATLSDPTTLIMPSNPELILRKKITHVNALSASAKDLVAWTNAMQALADRTRLGIPMTIATDPRHVYSFNPLASLPTEGFSKWPEPLGFAALGDTLIMRQFAEIAREEYRAVGLHLALHPMADLATEPRWPRINGTFGEDAALASKMVFHYIKGFQGDSLNTNSVACMTKHFAGGGPQKDGLDPHFEFGKEQVYPGRNFAYHLIPFKAAITAGTAQMMPYYGVPMHQSKENVGFAFNEEMINGLLRKKLGFKGVVCTDWGILTDKKILGFTVFTGPGWGVEKLNPGERILKAMNAGVDQFGGEAIPEELVKLVKQGRISTQRLDESVRRVLMDKFRLGLFDKPYVDAQKWKKKVGVPSQIQQGKMIQGKCMVLLKNDAQALPLQKGLKLYVENLSKTVAAKYGQVVDRPEDADFAIIRVQAPYQVHPGHSMSNFFHHDDLDFKGKERAHLLELMNKVPTIFNIYLDRPAVISEVAQEAKALIADFGAEDKVLLQVVFGQINPEGKLPFELPSSMNAVRAQKEDLPYDSQKPLYPFGFGMRYGAIKQ